jgi:hypothetical protein
MMNIPMQVHIDRKTGRQAGMARHSGRVRLAKASNVWRATAHMAPRVMVPFEECK